MFRKAFLRSKNSLSRRYATATVAGVATVLLLAACSGNSLPADTAEGDTSEELTEISIGVVPVVEMASIYIAMDQGYFEEAGLKVDAQVMESAPAMIPSVMNGQMTFGTAAVPAFNSAAHQGLPIIATTGAGLYPSVAEEDTTVVLVSPDSADEIKRPRDLEGKTVTTNAINSGPHVGLNATIKADGGDPSKVDFAVMPQADSLAAMKAGQVDAGLVAEPFRTTGMNEGLVRKFSAYVETDLEVVVPGSNAVVIFSSEQFTRENPEAVKKFNEAMTRANEDANNDPQMIVDAMAKHSDMTEETLDEILKPNFGTEVDPQGLQRVADLMTESGAIAEEFDVTEKVFQP